MPQQSRPTNKEETALKRPEEGAEEARSIRRVETPSKRGIRSQHEALRRFTHTAEDNAFDDGPCVGRQKAGMSAEAGYVTPTNRKDMSAAMATAYAATEAECGCSRHT
jgi:hypothetical protein